MNLVQGARYALVVRVLVDDWDGSDLDDIAAHLEQLGFADVHASADVPASAASLVPAIAGATFRYAEASWPGKSRLMGGLLGDYQIVATMTLSAPASPTTATAAPASSAAWWIAAGVAGVGIMAAIVRLRRKANR